MEVYGSYYGKPVTDFNEWLSILDNTDTKYIPLNTLFTTASTTSYTQYVEDVGPWTENPYPTYTPKYTCKYCQTKSSVFDRRGNCISCGAPIE